MSGWQKENSSWPRKKALTRRFDRYYGIQLRIQCCGYANVEDRNEQTEHEESTEARGSLEGKVNTDEATMC
jgi:hypothetical protein